MIQINYHDIGLTEYHKAWDIQKEFFTSLLHAKQSGSDTSDKNHIIFCEHPHVYTLGKSGSSDNLLINNIQLQAKNATFFNIDRGGDITYHGPGQMVVYPIIDLEKLGIGIKEYVHLLEESIILTLKTFSIHSTRLSGATGVWLDINTENVRKICAIGIKASKYITMHGLAFNVNTDLNYFNYINPCGFTDKAVTSVQKELGYPQDLDKIKSVFKNHFSDVFGVELS